MSTTSLWPKHHASGPRLPCQAWSGQIAIMLWIVVEEKWVPKNLFLHALNYDMVLRDPEAHSWQSVSYPLGGFSAYKLAQLIMPGTQFYTFAADATQPLFMGFSLLNQQKAAEAAFQQAEAQYRQTVVSAFENVADLLRAIQADTEAVKAAAYAETVAGKNLNIVRGQLKIGSVSVLAVLNAQQTYLLAIVAHAQARGNLLADVAGLFMALGGGWQDQNLKNLPPDGPDGPTKQQIEEIKPPVNPNLLPEQLSDVLPISTHPQ